MTSPTMKLAFLTYAAAPGLTADDLLAVAALNERGIHVVPRIWDAPPPADDAVDAVIVRSCWDYHLRSSAFLAVVDAFAASGIPVWNSPAVLRWNIDKRYLAELAEHGATLPRTVWVAQGAPLSLRGLIEENHLGEVVVKPRISLSAVDTFRASIKDAHVHEARYRSLVQEKDVLVQTFVPEILDGELSLLFLGGRFSHAVRKTPAKGDFRVQSDYGGTARLIEARPEWVHEAERILATRPPLLYARVDVVDTPTGLLWMELEATDAELFFRLDPLAASRFADAVVEFLKP